MIEGLLSRVFEDAGFEAPPAPWPRLGYDEAMLRFGSDKPDTRFALEISDLGAAVADTEFRVFKGVLDAGGVVRGFNAGAREATRAVADQLTEVVKRYGAGGLVWAVVQEDGTWRSPAAKALSDDDRVEDRGDAGGQARRPAADRRRREPDGRRRLARRAAARDRPPLRPDPRGPPRAAVGDRLPDVRVQRGRAALGRAAPPVHRAAGLVRGPGRAALARVRHRPRRLGDRRRVDPYQPPRGPAAGVHRARHLRGGGRRRASASCSTRSSTARRRTAGWRSGSTGSWRSSRAATRSAT